MPNWCCNRLRVSGYSEDIGQVRALFAGGGYPSYARASAEGIQLFLAGCAGVLRPVDGAHYAPYPALTDTKGYPSCAGEKLAGHDDVSGNQAFTLWLSCLREGVVLTEARCAYLHELWLASGLTERTWETLTAEQQAVIVTLWQEKYHDWRGTFCTHNPAEAWNRLCRGEAVTHQAVPFDMLLLCPPRLDVEINGYNGGLFSGVPWGFTDTTARCGTKWPYAHDLNISWSGATTFDADFDTPWSPPSEAVLTALSARYGVTVEHWYAEAGCDYCGYASYTGGEQTQELGGSLEWSDEEDEEGFREVTGPAWIVDNVAHFGG